MTLAEKAGCLFVTMAGMDGDGELDEVPGPSGPLSLVMNANSEMVVNRRMNHFNVVQAPSALAMATWNNNLPRLAERTRLGIPVTVASDPRHVSSNNVGAGIVFQHLAADHFAAIGNPDYAAQGRAAQRRSLVLLKNEGLLPLASTQKIYLSGFGDEVSVPDLPTVDRPEDADVIVQKLLTNPAANTCSKWASTRGGSISRRKN